MLTRRATTNTNTNQCTTPALVGPLQLHTKQPLQAATFVAAAGDG